MLLLIAAASFGSPRLQYAVTAARLNAQQPIISSHPAVSKAGAHTAASTFTFNFNPAYLTLPDGTGALLVRSSNGTNASTASTRANPDYLALTRLQSAAGGRFVFEDLSDASVVVRPHAAGKDDRGVQDPRVVRDAVSGTYWLTYRAYGSVGGNELGIARSEDALEWQTVAYLPSPFVSAVMLPREHGPHLMFHGCGSIDVSTSADFVHWTTINSTSAFGRPWWMQGNPPSDPTRGIWAEPGPTPVKLSDGNYLFLVIEAGAPDDVPPCHFYTPASETAYWGTGWAILDGDDPTRILQRGTRLLFPQTSWELNGTTTGDGASAWEMHGCMIGATLGLAPVQGERDAFYAFYGAGDSVSGVAKVSVQVPESGGVSNHVAQVRRAA